MTQLPIKFLIIVLLDINGVEIQRSRILDPEMKPWQSFTFFVYRRQKSLFFFYAELPAVYYQNRGPVRD